MLKRAATVVWWFGALFLVLAFAAIVTGLFSADRRDGVEVGACIIPVTLFIWAFSYILGGSFLRPPTGPLSPK